MPGKPTLILYANKGRAFIKPFVKNPQLRRTIMKLHKMTNYGELDKEYLAHRKDIRFVGSVVLRATRWRRKST